MGGSTVRPLSPEELARPADQVAPTLLGSLLIRRDEDTVVRILETEAYLPADPAAHSYGGRTPRNASMFGPPGHAYLYFTYGMHWCANVVTDLPGVPGAVLLRSAAVVRGGDAIRRRRGPRVADRDLLRGPARLAAGLGLNGAADGVDLLSPTSWLGLADDGVRPEEVATGPRVGVRLAPDRPLRFWWEGHPLISAYRRHPRAGS